MKRKRIVVTGAGSGIGKATALMFAEQGNFLALIDRNETNLRNTFDEIQAFGGQPLMLVTDISDAVQVKSAFEYISSEWGGLDIVIANAGINGVWAPLEHIEPNEWDETLNINLKGTFLTVKYALPLLKKGGGAIVITSSEIGTRVFTRQGSTAYACSKAAQIAFMKQQALELAKFKIRVNAVCPGWIKTEVESSMRMKHFEEFETWAEYPMGVIPLTKGILPEARKVAKLIAFLASDDADHITGTEVFIDGAESLLL